jgi:hypothetical protein
LDHRPGGGSVTCGLVILSILTIASFSHVGWRKLRRLA